MKILIKAVVLLCFASVLFAGCMPVDAAPKFEGEIKFIQFDPVKTGDEIAIIKTTHGDISMRLFPEEAPNTVKQFKRLVNEGFYNDSDIYLDKGLTTFVTGYDKDSENMTGKIATDDGNPVEREISQNLWHFSGAVSSLCYQKSRFDKTAYSDSRFFIFGDMPATTAIANELAKYNYPQSVIDEYKKHGGAPHYTGMHTIFAQVYDGMDVVNKIANLEIDEDTGKPVEEAKILSIELSTYQE